MKLLYVLLISMLAVTSAHAIGVSPPSGTINFAPNAQGEFDLLLSNSRLNAINTEVEVTGSLAEYFTVDTPRIGARSTAKAAVSYALPEDIAPGENLVRIRFVETFFTQDQGAVISRTAVTAKFTVWKPYPGKYAEIRVSPEHVAQGQNTQVQIQIFSRGDQAVTGEARIQIRDPDQQLVDTLILDGIRIEGDSDYSQFRQIFSENYEPGKYAVTATFDYNDQVTQDEKTLIIGEENIDILSLTPTTVYKDKEVTRFDVVVESLWNQPLRVVSATMQLGGQQAQTPSVTLAPFSTKTLTGYWPTDASVPEGEAQVLVTGSFDEGEPVEQYFSVQVYNETLAPQEQEPAVVLGLADIFFIVIAFGFVAYIILHIARRHQ